MEHYWRPISWIYFWPLFMFIIYFKFYKGPIVTVVVTMSQLWRNGDPYLTLLCQFQWWAGVIHLNCNFLNWSKLLTSKMSHSLTMMFGECFIFGCQWTSVFGWRETPLLSWDWTHIAIPEYGSFSGYTIVVEWSAIH